MAKDYDKAHSANMAKYAALIGHIYNTAAGEAAAIGASVTGFESNNPFTFDKYPATAQRIKQLLLRMYNDINTVIVDGVKSSWTLSNDKNNELSNIVFGDNVGKLSEAEYRKYYTNNDKALAAFLKRKENGLGLSDQVWKYTNQYKGEIELALDLGIGQGKSAAGIASDLRQYLNNPDALFRRVRDKYGNLHLSQHAAAYHPGPGVYRSAVRNSQRLSRTENNMAYRTADFLRWQEADYVVGIEIMLSNNHTIKNSKGKAVPFTDICDELQGRYPKTFHFRGWHPQCRCKAVPITKTKEEMERDTAAILAGKKPSTDSVNKVTDVPEAFKRWVENNTERFAKSAGQPYFIRDNFVDGNITQGLKADISTASIDTQKIQKTQKTQQQIDDIKNRWEERRMLIETIKMRAALVINLIQREYPEIDISKLQHYLNTNRLNESMTEIQSLLAQIEVVKAERERAKRKEYTTNIVEVEKILGIKKGAEMSFEDANELRGNPNFQLSDDYKLNCQCCVVANELRRRGFDVQAQPNDTNPSSIPVILSRRTQLAWRDRTTGAIPQPQRAGGEYVRGSKFATKTHNVMMNEFYKITSDVGRYHFSVVWKGSNYGHIMTAERLQNGNLRIYDPQTGEKYSQVSWDRITKEISLKYGISVLKVDELDINTNIIKGAVIKSNTTP